MSDADRSADSRELEALFDSIAAGVGPTAEPLGSAAAALLQTEHDGEGVADSDELQAFFDSVFAA